MASPPLADIDALAAWVGQEIPYGDARAAAVLSAASALVRDYTGQAWADPAAAPESASAVVVQVAGRVWMNPAGLESVTIDDSTRRWGSNGGLGLYLTEAEQDILNNFRTQVEPSGIGTLGTTRGPLTESTIYVPTGPPPSGYPFPWYDADDPLVQ